MERFNKEETICWFCKGGCSWERSFTPVNGWDAEPTILYKDSKNYDEQQSYIVRECPLFVDNGYRYPNNVKVKKVCNGHRHYNIQRDSAFQPCIHCGKRISTKHNMKTYLYCECLGCKAKYKVDNDTKRIVGEYINRQLHPIGE